jgi:hypothetical protein
MRPQRHLVMSYSFNSFETHLGHFHPLILRKGVAGGSSARHTQPPNLPEAYCSSQYCSVC